MDDVSLARLRVTLGLGAAPISRFPGGSVPVYAVGEDLVLKLFPAEDAGEARVEATVLAALEGRLSIPTPAFVGAGEAEGWHYVLMRRLSGEPLSQAWSRLSTSERAELAERIGVALAELHAVTDPSLATLEPLDWRAFVRERRDVVVAEQRERGLGDEWLARIPGFLDEVELGSGEPVLLHTEVMREHVLLREGTATPSGLFDFEPAMPGAPEYDFVAVAVYLAGGGEEGASFMRTLLRAYGYAPSDVDERFARRCLAYTLLHRYGNLRAYLDWMPAPPEPTLDSLAVTWFAPFTRS
ncbi:aminoglycoside 3'-phosphotransferase/choline kinase family protein [Saccharomonospora sp. NPDC006951]